MMRVDGWIGPTIEDKGVTTMQGRQTGGHAHALIGVALIVAIIVTIAFLTKARAESPQSTIRDSRGATIGTATQNGNTTVFRDSRGATTGTATVDSQGNTVFRDSRGATTGTASNPLPGTRR
jgi:hypothetical protein